MRVKERERKEEINQFLKRMSAGGGKPEIMPQRWRERKKKDIKNVREKHENEWQSARECAFL